MTGEIETRTKLVHKNVSEQYNYIIRLNKIKQPLLNIKVVFKGFYENLLLHNVAVYIVLIGLEIKQKKL